MSIAFMFSASEEFFDGSYRYNGEFFETQGAVSVIVMFWSEVIIITMIIIAIMMMMVMMMMTIMMFCFTKPVSFTGRLI